MSFYPLFGDIIWWVREKNVFLHFSFHSFPFPSYTKERKSVLLFLQCNHLRVLLQFYNTAPTPTHKKKKQSKWFEFFFPLFQVQVSFPFSWDQWHCDSRWQSCRSIIQAHLSATISPFTFICWVAVEGFYLVHLILLFLSFFLFSRIFGVFDKKKCLQWLNTILSWKNRWVI